MEICDPLFCYTTEKFLLIALILASIALACSIWCNFFLIEQLKKQGPLLARWREEQKAKVLSRSAHKIESTRENVANRMFNALSAHLKGSGFDHLALMREYAGESATRISVMDENRAPLLRLHFVANEQVGVQWGANGAVDEWRLKDADSFIALLVKQLDTMHRRNTTI